MFRARTLLAAAILAAVIVLLVAPGLALAHTKVTAGKYEMEVGWVAEPPLIGQPNAVFLSITDTDANKPVDGVNTLNVSVTTGGQTRDLKVRPLGEDAPGQYAADFIPTVRGAYTVKLTGKIEDQDVNTTTDIEEVEAPEDYQFPVALPSLPQMNQQLTDLRTQNQALQAEAGRSQSLALGGIALGAVGVIVGLVALRRK